MRPEISLLGVIEWWQIVVYFVSDDSFLYSPNMEPNAVYQGTSDLPLRSCLVNSLVRASSRSRSGVDFLNSVALIAQAV
jgi:hypothetical protein